MKNFPDPVNIKIDPKWLKSGYYVYAVIIKHDNQTYIYIGQTGDTHHPTARGPLFRISGHFTKTKSSDQNQIIKGFRKHISPREDINDKLLEEALLKAEINYYYWLIDDFVFDSNKKDRDFKRKKTQFIEHWLIWRLQKEENIKIFNKRVVTEISDSNRKDSRIKNDKEKLLEKSLQLFEYIKTKI